MKKIVKIFAICFMLLVMAFGLTACTGSAKNTLPDYIAKYQKYDGAVYSTTEYVEITTDTFAGCYTWIDNDGNIGYCSKINDSKYELKPIDGSTGYTLEKKNSKWVVDDDYKVKPASTSGCNSNISTYVILGVLLVAVVGLFVWSNISSKKKEKQAKATVNSLKVGDRVKTIGGICGFVSEINDAENTFVLEIKAGNTSSFVKFDKGAIYQTAPAEGYKSPAPNPEVKEEPVEDKKEEKEVSQKKASTKKKTENK